MREKVAHSLECTGLVAGFMPVWRSAALGKGLRLQTAARRVSSIVVECPSLLTLAMSTIAAWMFAKETMTKLIDSPQEHFMPLYHLRCVYNIISATIWEMDASRHS